MLQGPIVIPADTDLKTAVVGFRDTFLIHVGSRTLTVTERIFLVHIHPLIRA